MPGKLKALLAIYGLSMLMDALTASWLGLAIGLVCFLGLLRANDIVRKVVIILSCAGLANAVVDAVMYVLHFEGSKLVLIGLALTLVALTHLFALWVLTRADVKHWMFYRGIQQLEAN